MNDIDKLIHKLFSERWGGYLSTSRIEEMRIQLHKNLQNQLDGFWSGHTAYHLMVDIGFLIDSKRIRIKDTNMAEGKKLTELGKMFMDSMNQERQKGVA